MAFSISECLPRDVFVWITKIPVENETQYSWKLQHHKMTFQLEFSVNMKEKIYTIRIIDFHVKTHKNDYLPFDINVHVKNSEVHLPLSYWYICGRDPKTELYQSIIWKYSEADILKAFPGFHTSEFLIFLIVFHTTNNNSFLVEPSSTEKVNKSVRSSDEPVEKKEKSVQTSRNMIICLESLSEDLSKLVDQRSHSDLLLACGDRSARAHKSVLSTRSKVFAAMLRNDMEECKTSVVQVPGIDPVIFESFLHYLYSGNLPDLTVDTAKRFYKAADEYAIEALTRRCASFLQEHMNTENACELLALADSHGDAKFKEYAVDYILEKKVHLQDDIWVPFCKRQPVLANEVLNRFFKLHYK